MSPILKYVSSFGKHGMGTGEDYMSYYMTEELRCGFLKVKLEYHRYQKQSNQNSREMVHGMEKRELESQTSVSRLPAQILGWPS